MGWSHSARAGERLAAIERACLSQTGSQNRCRFRHDGVIIDRFFEVTTEDQEDGGISCEWVDFPSCRVLGKFLIRGDDGLIETAHSDVKTELTALLCL